MSKFAKQFPDVINEGSTAAFFAVLKDPLGNLLPLSVVDSIALTLFDVASGAIVNGRNSQDIKNANDVTVNESAVLHWQMQIEDTSILDGDAEYETHRGEFIVNYNSGSGRLVFDADFMIRNLTKYTP